MAKKPNETDKENESVIPNAIDLDELIKTTKIEILPDYAKEMIPFNDFKTTRRVIIESLPKIKDINTKKWRGKRRFMTISDNGILYQLAIDSISLFRSLIALDIKMNNVETKEQIDLSRLIGKQVGIKRIEFINKDKLSNQCLNFYPLVN